MFLKQEKPEMDDFGEKKIGSEGKITSIFWENIVKKSF